MDFPTCRACKQSVLDDGVEYCPFCGAHMQTGKPGPKAPPAAKTPRSAPTKSAAPEPPPPQSAPKPGRTVSRPAPAATAAAPGDDDPFAVAAATDDAVPAAPKKSAARPLEVVCPMCETHGFVPAAAAGKLVRCSNKTCLVPVFSAPAPVVEAPPPPPPPPKNYAGLITGGAIGLILLVGGAWAYWAFVLSAPTQRPIAGGDAPSVPTLPPGAKPLNAEPEPVAPTEAPEKTGPAVAAPALGPAELQDEILSVLERTAPLIDRNRSKPVSRRGTALAYALAGRAAQARQELAQFDKVRTTEPVSLKIEPLAALAWLARESDPAAAGKLVEEAWQLAPSIPQFGRERFEPVVQLAALLIASGRTDDAEQLLRDHRASDVPAQLAARITIARTTGRFIVESSGNQEFRGPWSDPPRVAVAVVLAMHGQAALIPEWAQRMAGKPAGVESLLAGARAEAIYASRGRPDAPPQLPADALARWEAAVAELNGGAQLRGWVALAKLAPASDGVESPMGRARSALDALPAPAPAPPFADFVELLNWTPPAAAADAQQAALAAVELAELQTGAEAWKAFQKGLAFARSAGLPRDNVAQLQSSVSGVGTSILRSQLRAALELSSDEEASRKINELKRQLAEADKSAAFRTELQALILERAARHGNWSEAVAYLQDPAKSPDALQTTSLPARLHALAPEGASAEQLAGLADAAQKASDDVVVLLERELKGLAGAAATAPLYGVLRRLRNAPEAELLLLYFAGRTLAQAPLEEQAVWINRIENPAWREDVWRLAGAVAARKGNAVEAWQAARRLDLPPTELIAWGLGLTEGLTAARPAP